MKDDKESGIEGLSKLLGDTPVLVGLRQQGHMEVVARMLAEGRSWSEIGRTIGWDGETARRWYGIESKVGSDVPQPVSSDPPIPGEPCELCGDTGEVEVVDHGALPCPECGRRDSQRREQGLIERLGAAERERDEFKAFLNTPETQDFIKAVPLEAAHQRARWGSEHDAGKTPADWFWLVGYLAGKCLASHIAGNTEKALHHTISTAAALANWHAAILGKTNMRPGIMTPQEGNES